jgi:hypothetical protein
MQTGFDSSYSDYGMLDDLPAFHCAQDKSLPTTDEQFNGNYPFNEQKNVNVYGEQASELIILFSHLVLLVGTIKACIILFCYQYYLYNIGLPRECNGIAVH